jgi:hypothetical protein
LISDEIYKELGENEKNISKIFCRVFLIFSFKKIFLIKIMLVMYKKVTNIFKVNQLFKKNKLIVFIAIIKKVFPNALDI